MPESQQGDLHPVVLADPLLTIPQERSAHLGLTVSPKMPIPQTQRINPSFHRPACRRPMNGSPYSTATRRRDITRCVFANNRGNGSRRPHQALPHLSNYDKNAGDGRASCDSLPAFRSTRKWSCNNTEMWFSLITEDVAEQLPTLPFTPTRSTRSVSTPKPAHSRRRKGKMCRLVQLLSLTSVGKTEGSNQDSQGS